MSAAPFLCQRDIGSHTLFVYRAFFWSLSVFTAFDPRGRRLARRLGYHPGVSEAQRSVYAVVLQQLLNPTLRFAPLGRRLPNRYVIHMMLPHVDELCRITTTVYALPRIGSSDF